MSARLSAAGFFIVGVIVAAGMMGGLALLLTNIMKDQHVAQKKAETGAELLGLHRRILAVLYDGDACLETLGVGGSLHNGRTLGELKNKGGRVVVRRGADINRMLRVQQMEVQDVSGSLSLPSLTASGTVTAGGPGLPGDASASAPPTCGIVSAGLFANRLWDGDIQWS